MRIEMPDPDPGRCKNIRQVVHSDGSIENLRCLDYEAVRHVCEFPEPELRPVTQGNWSWTYNPQAPQRWVKPDEIT